MDGEVSGSSGHNMGRREMRLEDVRLGEETPVDVIRHLFWFPSPYVQNRYDIGVWKLCWREEQGQ